MDMTAVFTQPPKITSSYDIENKIKKMFQYYQGGGQFATAQCSAQKQKNGYKFKSDI